MPAIEKSGIKVNFINERWFQFKDCAIIGEAVSIISHLNAEGNWNHK
jgi:hypothetical protein